MPKPFSPPPIDADLLTIEQLCALLDTTPGSVYVQRHRGLPPASLGVVWKSRLWWRLSDVQAYLAETLSGEFDRRFDARHKRKSQGPVTEARRLHDAKKSGDVE